MVRSNLTVTIESELLEKAREVIPHGELSKHVGGFLEVLVLGMKAKDPLKALQQEVITLKEENKHLKSQLKEVAQRLREAKK